MADGVNDSEHLVLGARLSCSKGTYDNFLFVTDKGEYIKKLPAANVTDSIAGENILPFGLCQVGFLGSINKLTSLRPVACTIDRMKLRKEWENNPKQDKFIARKEIITKNSTLVCDQGGNIIPIDSGQDGEFVAQLLFLLEMMGEYPELFNVLMEPNGSILISNLRNDALEFLEKAVEFAGGKIELLSLLNGTNLYDKLILLTLGKLNVDISRPDNLLNHMENLISTKGLKDADMLYLNTSLLDGLAIQSKEYEESVMNGNFFGLDRHYEENRKIVEELSSIWENVTGFALKARHNRVLERYIIPRWTLRGK